MATPVRRVAMVVSKFNEAKIFVVKETYRRRERH